MREIMTTGKTVEEAIEEGLKELSATRDQVTIEVMEEGKKGVFGLGGKSAQVKMIVKEDPVQRAVRVTQEVIDLMGIEGEVSGERANGEIILSITGSGGILIGRRGQTLYSLQYLLTRILNQSAEDWDKITVDVEGYRGRREKEMTELAERLYRNVLDSGKEITVKNLSAHDRRIIHMLLKERPDVETFSHGTGHLRKLVITPLNRKRRPQRSPKPQNDAGSASKRIRTFTKRFESPSGNSN